MRCDVMITMIIKLLIDAHMVGENRVTYWNHPPHHHHHHSAIQRRLEKKEKQ